MENGAVFSKKIQRMFTAIAPWYDFLNRLLSLGQDQYWRKTAVDYLEPESGQKILDLATGTADVALDIASRFRNGIRVYGVDFSRQMLLFLKLRGFEIILGRSEVGTGILLIFVQKKLIQFTS